MATLSSLSLSALAAALSSVQPGTVLAALAIATKQGDSVDRDTFVDLVSDLLHGAVDTANQSLSETNSLDMLVRYTLSRMVLESLETSVKLGAKPDKAVGAQRDKVHAAIVKQLITAEVANGNDYDLASLNDTVDAALSRSIASRQDDGTLTNPSAPYVSGKGKGGIKPNGGVSAAALAARFKGEYEAFLASVQDDEGDDAQEEATSSDDATPSDDAPSAELT